MTVDRARIEAQLSVPRMTLVAGETDGVTITIQNRTALPDDFELAVIGIPANWCTFSKPSVNLFPNWTETSSLTINLGAKVKPDLYRGAILITAKNQPAARTEVPITIEVLAPLVIANRLQPRRATGYKAKYNLIMRNRSMSEGFMSMRMSDLNPYCEGKFVPSNVRVSPGQSQAVELTIALRNRTPRDQKEQIQSFEVAIQPQWLVNGNLTSTPLELIDGEYVYRSPFSFFGRHPWLFINFFILLGLILIWTLLLPLIQDVLVNVATDKINVVGTSGLPKVLSIDQKTASDIIQNLNPLSALLKLEVRFDEPSQKASVTARMLFFGDPVPGKVVVNPGNGKLEFVADKPDQLNSFPLFLFPPNKVLIKISDKLRRSLIEQRQKMFNTRIEGTTIFVDLRACAAVDPACTP